MRPRAIIFDFDGTLADSYGAITASVNEVRARRSLPPLLEAEVRRHVGHGLAQLLTWLVPGSDPEENVQWYRAHHGTVMQSGTRLLPGVEATLRSLRGRGLRLGVCSNKLRVFTRDLLDHLGLADLIAAVVGPEDAPRLKPAPEMLLAALERLAVTPDEALYVGDMRVDIQTARAAGVAVWVIATGSEDAATLRAAGPDRLLERFADIADLLYS